MSNMNYFNKSTPDATSSSMANMELGHDLGMHRRYGDEEFGDPNYLQRHSTTLQDTFSSRPQWRSDSQNSNNIRCNHTTNHNCTGCAVLYIFDEHLSKEKNEEKKEETSEGKKGQQKEEKNEWKKEAKTKEIQTGGIFKSTPESVSELADYSRASSQLIKASNSDKRILEGQSTKKSTKDNSSFRSISYSSESGIQGSLSHDSTGKRFVSFPTGSEWSDKPKPRNMEIWELCGNNSLDSHSHGMAKYSDPNAHNQCSNKRNDSTLSELYNLPSYIYDHLDKNNRFGFHKITNKDSIDFVDAEYIEYLDEKYGITGIQPVFVDHSGLTIWLLDKTGNMYQWNEMEQNLLYMGKNLIDGLTNNFIHPENICQITKDGRRVSVMEFENQMKEKAKRMWNERQIIKNK